MAALVALGAGRMLFLVLVSNLYGAEVLGVVGLATTAMVFLALVLGVAPDYAATYLAGQHPEQVGNLRFNALLIGTQTLLLSIPVAIVMYLLLGATVFADFGGLAGAMVPLLAGAHACQLQLQGVHTGRGDFRVVTEGHLVHYGALVPSAWAMWASGFSGEDLLVAYAISLVWKSAYQAYRLDPCGVVDLAEALSMFRRQLETGIHMMLGVLANLLNYRLDAMFIAYFLPTASVGIYTVATTVAEATLYLPRALGMAAFSWTASITDGDAVGVSGTWRSRVRRLFLGVGGAGIALAAIAAVAVQFAIPMVFGEDFRAAVRPAQVLLAATFFSGLGFLAMSLLYGTGHAHRNTKLGIAAAVINALANVVLIPRFGLLGAAFASLLSYFVYATLAATALWRAPADPSGTS